MYEVTKRASFLVAVLSVLLLWGGCARAVPSATRTPGVTPTSSPTLAGLPAPIPAPTAKPALTPAVTPAASSIAAGSPFDEGLRYLESHEFEKAIDAFTRDIELNPQYAEAYYNRGLAYGNLGQDQRAVDDFDEAIRLNPQYAEAYLTSAYLHRRALCNRLST